MSDQLHAPDALPPEKKLRYPMYRRMARSQNRSQFSGEEKKSIALSSIDPQFLGLSFCSLGTILRYLHFDSPPWCQLSGHPHVVTEETA